MAQNEAIFDRWTWAHIGAGLLAGLSPISLPWAVGLAVAYEAIEWAHEYPSGSRLFGTKRPESARNIMGDLSTFALAFEVARAIYPRKVKP